MENKKAARSLFIILLFDELPSLTKCVQYVTIFMQQKNNGGCFRHLPKGGVIMEEIISFALIVMIIIIYIKK